MGHSLSELTLRVFLSFCAPSVARVSRTQPSGLASTYYHGVIQVIRDSDSATLGYISKNSLSTHQLGYQPDLGNALIVDFSTPGGATVASQVEISTEVSR